MPRLSPHRVPLLLLSLAAACAPKLEATGCRSDTSCPAGSRCQAGVCTADGRPTAILLPIGPVEAFALVELDGSSSSDPDGADAVAEHVWTVRALDARCAPPAVAGSAPRARVRFGCPGRYEVTLAVRDGLGAESEPARAEVDVLPATGEPAVAAGADVATEHACGGTPILCRTADAVRLAASAAPGLALRWSVEPPAERPLDAHRSVRFVPGSAAPDPAVAIETDGAAISGDWVFRVEALDAYGVVGAAHTRVSVRNRAPVVTVQAAGPFPHAFDPGRSVFTAAGVLAFSVVDPDGDPVEVSGVWRHEGDGGASFDGDLSGTSVTFTVEVPYARPEDALRLRGGEGLSRRIELLAVDANRTLGRGSGDVEIGNRPPIPAGGTFDDAVPHTFDRQRSLYVAWARAGAWVDPDGDPILGGAGPGPCATATVHGGDAIVECAVPFDGVPAVSRLAGLQTFAVAMRDPWDAATAVPLHDVVIGNSPPTLGGTPAPATSCAVTRVDPLRFGCWFSVAVSAVAFDLAPDAVDPDGDPLLLVPSPSPGGSATPTAAVCTGPGCVDFRFLEPAHVLECTRAWQPWSFLSASDGLERAEIGVSPGLGPCVP